MEKSVFQIQGVEHKAYEGVTNGQSFGGYQCPWFSKEVALVLMNDLNDSWKGSSTKEFMSYDKNQDCFIYGHSLMGDDQVTKFKAQKIDNKVVYGIGTNQWCWHSMESMKDEMKGKKMPYSEPELVKNKAPHLRLV